MNNEINTENNNTKNKLCVGILAHVDAGKTTLTESLLHASKVIENIGRVDNGNAFLDTDYMEKQRGITIYSKTARIPLNATELILLDTPGHADFSTEMERALSVLDFAILLISGPAGIQSHTKTLWSLLKYYRIPTIIFVNKMDMPGADSDSIINELHAKLSDQIINFTSFEDNEIPYSLLPMDEVYESIASQSEDLMEEYLEQGQLSTSNIQKAFYDRQLFPLFYGSALKEMGIKCFLEGISYFTEGLLDSHTVSNENEFSGYIYKISHDNNGRRLSYIKVISGSLKVKSLLNEEKINEIHIYNGIKYQAVQEVCKGEICCIPGLKNTFSGQTLGLNTFTQKPVLAPALSYAVHFPADADKNKMLVIMKELEDEDPSLNVEYNEETKEINISLMGDIQTEIIKEQVFRRYGININVSDGKICYKETIDATGYGVGHFEPLRHYAEVHLKIEPLERGSGLEFETDVSEDLLDKNWQRLILTHLKEREHRGVLLGSPVTDIRFTLVAGKAHNKHTEGGDFRQATYRAIRQGLMTLFSEGHCHLLEPYYNYSLTVPDIFVGKAMTDITSMSGTCAISENDYDNGLTVLCGQAPVSTMNGYMKEVSIYTKGQGLLSLNMAGYDDCHNEEEVLSHSRYNPDADLRNPSASVFCMHGAGTVVPWYEVSEYQHIEFDGVSYKDRHYDIAEAESAAANKARRKLEMSDMVISTEEIDSILKANSNANQNGRKGSYKGISSAVRNRNREKKSIEAKDVTYKGTEYKEKYLLVDGYNVIHAWDELKLIASSSLDGAVGKLNDILCNYQAITGYNLIVVYDAYKIKGHQTEINNYHNITVVFTRESQTADQYIEKYAHDNANKYQITVVTSDGLEQLITRGAGAFLISSREFEMQVQTTLKEFAKKYGIL